MNDASSTIDAVFFQPYALAAMYLNPTLLLLLGLTFVFAPSLQEWVLSGNDAWYRPYIVWVGLIIFIYWSQRGKARDEF